MNNKKKTKQYIWIAVIVVILLGGAWWVMHKPTVAAGAYDQFAQCLTSKGVAMYGAYWCPHCANQKKLFGNSYRFIKYVECANDPQTCINAGVNGYPTWKFADGSKLEGEQDLQALADKTSCPLTQTSQQ